MLLACHNGHDPCVRLLMSYMAPFPSDVSVYLASPLPDATRKWVAEAERWSSPLHFVDVNSCERTLSLLRGGADIHASRRSGLPTPLDVALAKGGDSASLVLRAGTPWSVGTHSLFPSQARRRAYELLMVGRLFASSRFEGQEQAFFDVWQFGVMPHAIVRTTASAE